MLRLLSRILPLALGATILLVAQSADTRVKQMTAEDLKKLIDSKTKFFFLDVREPKEIAELGTMAGYVNIPMSELEKRATEIPKASLVVTA
ncbi:MAG: hypothetical protein FJW31_10770 [Acidobacteria bacterium]|nr:hypothetical protein [Acidobacteriota bacterium]